MQNKTVAENHRADWIRVLEQRGTFHSISLYESSHFYNHDFRLQYSLYKMGESAQILRFAEAFIQQLDQLLPNWKTAAVLAVNNNNGVPSAIINICQAIQQKTGVQTLTLVRNIATPQDVVSHERSLEKRIEKTHGVFQCADPEEARTLISGRPVFILDDMISTGSTANTMVTAVKSYDPQGITFLSIIHMPVGEHFSEEDRINQAIFQEMDLMRFIQRTDLRITGKLVLKILDIDDPSLFMTSLAVMSETLLWQLEAYIPVLLCQDWQRQLLQLELQKRLISKNMLAF